MANEAGCQKRSKLEEDVLASTSRPCSSSVFVHDRESVIHKAIADDRDINAVRQLLETGLVKLCYGQGNNCFILASRMKNWEMLALLLQHEPAGVNARDENGTTVLMCHFDKLEPFRRLVELGADLHTCDSNGKSVLMYVLDGNHIPVQELLQHNVDVNWRDSRGQTPLMEVVMNNSWPTDETIKALLAAGANPNLSDNEGYTPLIRAISYYFYFPEITDVLLHAGAIAKQTRPLKLYSTLHEAYREFERLLLNDFTLQMFAALYEKLIEAGADHFETNDSGETVFQLLLLSLQFKGTDGLQLVTPFLSVLLVSAAEESLQRNDIPLLLYPQVAVLRALEDFGTQMEDLWPVIDKLVQPKYMNGFDVYIEEFFMNSHVYSEFLLNEHAYYDTISTFVETMALDNFPQLQMWLDTLLERGFKLKSSNPNVISLLTVLMQASFKKLSQDEQAKLLQLIQYFIREGISVTQKILYFEQEVVNEARNQLDVPDCLLLALVSGHTKCLRALLPYWSGQPFSLLLLLLLLLDDGSLNLACIEELKRVFKVQFPMLAQFGGPINDPDMVRNMARMLAAWLLKDEQFHVVYNDFMKLHRTVPSLEVLSRTVIRSRVTSGNDLPEKLASLIPPEMPVMRAFITLQPYEPIRPRID